MSGLSVFFAENVAKVENQKLVASKRFQAADGKPIEWEICAVTSELDDTLRSKNMRKEPVPGKPNHFSSVLDTATYLSKLAAECTVYPDLNNAELQNSYGTNKPEVLLRRMLLPGEYADYLAAVQSVCGFESMDEQVEEVKN